MKQGGSKTFQIRHSGKVGCLDISNVVNTKIAKFLKQQQPHGGTNHLLCAKKAETRGKNVISNIKLFQQVQLVNFYIYMTCRLPKVQKTIARILSLHMDV